MKSAARWLGLLALPGCIFPLPPARTNGQPLPILFIQAQGHAAGNAPLAVTLPAPSTPGHALIAGVMWEPSSVPAPTVTDDAADGWQLAGSPVVDFSRGAEITYAADIDGGPTHITLSGSGYSHLEIAVAEYSGVDTTSPWDAFASSQGGGPIAQPSAQLTTTLPGELLFAWGVSLTDVDAGSNFLPRASANGDLAEDSSAPTVGVWAASATTASSSWLLLLASFKAGTQGG